MKGITIIVLLLAFIGFLTGTHLLTGFGFGWLGADAFRELVDRKGKEGG